MHARPIVAGVDGGGTKTEILLASPDGQILGSAVAGSSNYQKVGFDNAAAAITEAMAAACAGAGLSEEQIGAIGFGLAGVDRREDQQMWEQWAARSYPGRRLAVVNDAELPLAAGTPEGWGVGVICGTGSTCVGRSPGGEFARADGWGYILGDHGSGYWIGHAAMQAVMRAYDGRTPATALTDGVLGHWKLRDAEALLDKVYFQQTGPAEVAALARVVNRCAEEGDAAALHILRGAGQEIASTISAVVRKLALSGPVPCALAGGVVVQSRLMLENTLAAARELGLTLAPVQQVAQPALGAVRIALRLL